MPGANYGLREVGSDDRAHVPGACKPPTAPTAPRSPSSLRDLSTTPSSPPDWPVLFARYQRDRRGHVDGHVGGEVAVRHPDPLGALQRGEVSSVLVRGVLQPEQSANLLRRLLATQREQQRNTAGKRKTMKGGYVTSVRQDVGATLDALRSPASYAAIAPAINRLFDDMFRGASRNGTTDDVHGIELFEHVLQRLARRSGKTVHTPQWMAAAAPVKGVPAIFRTLKGRAAFPPHIDGFHQRVFEPHEGRNDLSHRPYVVQDVRYGPHDCMSAVLVIAGDPVQPLSERDA